MKSYRSILLIDDHTYTQQFFINVIQSFPGINLFNIAISGKAAIQQLNALKVLPDIIFIGFHITLKAEELSLNGNCGSTFVRVIKLADFLSYENNGCFIESSDNISSNALSMKREVRRWMEDHII